MKFRKKPVVIDAVQLTWRTWNEVCEFLTEHGGEVRGGWVDPVTGVLTEEDVPPGDLSLDDAQIGCVLVTVHGEEAIARQGDWIVAEPKAGRFYPVKPDIFTASYEPVG